MRSKFLEKKSELHDKNIPLVDTLNNREEFGEIIFFLK